MSQASKSKHARIGSILSTVLLIFAAICFLQSVISVSRNRVPCLFGIYLLSVQTESMVDTFMPGDLIVDTRVDESSVLEAGDVITFWTTIGGRRVLNTHRIVDIHEVEGQLLFETCGDNNTVNDPEWVRQDEVIGRYRFRIPGCGKLLDLFKTQIGYLLVVLIPAGIFFVVYLVRFVRTVSQEQMREQEESEQDGEENK